MLPKTGQFKGLRPNPHTLGVTPLEPGEVSEKVRIRAKKEVYERFEALTAAQRGQFLENAFRQQEPEAPPLLEHFFNPERLQTLGQVKTKAHFDALAVLHEGRDRM